MLKNDEHFKAFPQLNDLPDQAWLHSSASINLTMTDLHFNSDSLQDKLIRSLAVDNLLPIKEVLECFEYFHRIRRQTRAKVVADLCCGHGLLGLLFAIYERKVDKVLLVDKNEPESRQKIIKALSKVAPWIESKIENKACKISPDVDWLPAGTAIVSAHACGKLSDLCIEMAIISKGPMAILPCCYPKSSCKSPISLQRALGFEMAFDIERTYHLEKSGFHSKWSYIPKAISPMNRIIQAKPQ